MTTLGTTFTHSTRGRDGEPVERPNIGTTDATRDFSLSPGGRISDNRNRRTKQSEYRPFSNTERQLKEVRPIRTN